MRAILRLSTARLLRAGPTHCCAEIASRLAGPLHPGTSLSTGACAGT